MADQADQIMQNLRKMLLSMPDLRKVNTLRFGDQLNIEMIRMINELLPELEVLKMQYQNDSPSLYRGEPINFKAVVELTVHISGMGTHPSSRVPLKFDRLEHLVLNGYSCQSQKWTEFIVQNKQLRTLVLMPGLCILANENMDQHLMQFAVQLTKLDELFVYGDFISSPEQMIQFVGECKQLRKLHLRFLYSDGEKRESFTVAMTSNWKVTQKRIEERCDDLIFEREI
ncbi:uncharacterized protein LOC116348216 [Contarinia nasturtii]|uniref:uncharacterized protein LOC116348216 n=1 Tax=Contarinia nasturtii TaxID=265458 RepID=UPI0012D3F51D|nr:uncharacterized protein LOC116348216 [Contarinia nasturtii]